MFEPFIVEEFCAVAVDSNRVVVTGGRPRDPEINELEIILVFTLF